MGPGADTDQSWAGRLRGGSIDFKVDSFRFKDCPVIALAAKPGGPEAPETEKPHGVPELIELLKSQTYLPHRDPGGALLIAVDHCFSIRGQGIVMAGTILQGALAVNDTVEIPALKRKIGHFKASLATCATFHIAIGHETVTARFTFFGLPPGETHQTSTTGPQPPSQTSTPPEPDHRTLDTPFSFDREYFHQDEYGIGQREAGGTGQDPEQWALLEFERPVPLSAR